MKSFLNGGTGSHPLGGPAGLGSGGGGGLACRRSGGGGGGYSGGSSLRSKRFRRVFRPLEAFFVLWRRNNWGERNTDGSSGKGEGR